MLKNINSIRLVDFVQEDGFDLKSYLAYLFTISENLDMYRSDDNEKVS